MNVSR